MTVLTDEERQNIEVYPWERTVDLIKRVESAVLEKLKQQEPVAWRFYQSGFQHFTDEKRDWYDAVNIEEVTPLYAAMEETK